MMDYVKNPTKIVVQFSRWISDLDRRFLLLILLPLSLFLYVSFSSINTSTPSSSVLVSFSNFGPFKSIFSSYGNAPIGQPHLQNETRAEDLQYESPAENLQNETIALTVQKETGAEDLRYHSPAENLQNETITLNVRNQTVDVNFGNETRVESLQNATGTENAQKEPRIAVCLVGGARRFELTGPSIITNILKVYKYSDLFVHSPLDSNSYKFSLLKKAPRVAAVKIFRQQRIPETESQLRVLTSMGSPNGIQGLLQYFNLVEGCLTMIKSYQEKNNFTYDWIIRTRVDGYWSKPLTPDNFIPGTYLVPPGSSYGGLNDRFGVGDLNTSTVALSRLSLIPQLEAARFTQLNSESAFRAQLTSQKVPYVTKALPFCVVTERKYSYPPIHFGVPVAAMSSPGPLSGAKCRPCTPVCTGSCIGPIMNGLYKFWGWTEWAENTIQLCDAHDDWENGWEKVFDTAVGKKLAAARKEVSAMNVEHCVKDLEKLINRTTDWWQAPPAVEICRLGLRSR